MEVSKLAGVLGLLLSLTLEGGSLVGMVGEDVGHPLERVEEPKKEARNLGSGPWLCDFMWDCPTSSIFCLRSWHVSTWEPTLGPKSEIPAPCGAQGRRAGRVGGPCFSPHS